jgi:uncharacterized membrane protein (UPF0127 family)
METRRFCVYNQTSECFLSLGVTEAETVRSQFKNLVGRQTQKYDEGLWVVPSSGFHSFKMGTSAPLDLVYLDGNCQVVHVMESLQKNRMAPVKPEAASVLALPAHTIYSSQTQPGDQLVICEAEEMEFQLGSTPGFERTIEMSAFDTSASNSNSITRWLPRAPFKDRREARRKVWPRLVAHDWDGAELVVHGIRDASATGLYLLTEKRWPLGALVWMTLQRTDISADCAESSITVQMKVTRWGTDGVGLAFLAPDVPESNECLELKLEQEQASAEREEFTLQDVESRFIN